MKIIFPLYVLRRMIERSISVENVRAVLESGEVIEEYKADVPPRYLMLAWVDDRALHLVAEYDPLTHETTVVTVYEPSRKHWKSGFRERKKK